MTVGNSLLASKSHKCSRSMWHRYTYIYCVYVQLPVGFLSHIKKVNHNAIGVSSVLIVAIYWPTKETVIDCLLSILYSYTLINYILNCLILIIYANNCFN